MIKPIENPRRVEAVEDATSTYFAGANTAGGFFSFYPEIFDERSLARLYVIKGGPGSGKSSLMRRLLRLGGEAGLCTEAYLCGSDPASLDAAIICGAGGRVAMIDATSPHAYDPRYPGAVTHLFDCGAFWDEGALSSHREAITVLADAKSAAYKRAYRYLAALGGVRRDIRRLGEEALDVAKMRAACRRFALGLKGRDAHGRGEVPATATAPAAWSAKKTDVPKLAYPTETVRKCANCFSMRMEGELDIEPTFTTVTVTDSFGVAPAFLSAMVAELSSAGIFAARIVDCVEPDIIRALVLPAQKLRIICTERPIDGAAKNFNMTRFLGREALAASRNKRSFARRCAASLAEGANQAFADAGECHFALEDIYVAAMDFNALTAAADPVLAQAISIAAGR